MAKMTVTRSFNGNLDASFSTYLNLKPHDSTTTATIHGHAHQNPRLGCAVDDCEISIFDAQKYFNEGNNSTGPPPNHPQIKLESKRVPLTTRLSLGDLPRISSASSVDTPSRNNYRVGVGGRSFHATPTASSEASWNSQTGLLSNPPGSIKVSLRNVPTTTTTTPTPYVHQKKTKASSRSNWFFGRRCPCPCTGQKSIQVDEKFDHPKFPVRAVVADKPIMLKTVENELPVAVKQETIKLGSRALIHQELTVSPPKFSLDNKSGSSGGSPELVAVNNGAAENTHRIVATGRTFSDSNTVAGFSFPILKNNNPVKKMMLNPMRVTPPPINTNLNSDEPPRESLEVFRPYDDQETLSRNPSLDLPAHSRERRSFTFPASPKSRMTTVTDDDVASDASSDLFEIESFSTQTTTTTCPVLYRRRDSLEEEEASTSSMHLRRRLSAVTNGGMDGLYYPMTPTECYEPSEASIDWSVTTAEGYERGSLSNYPIANGLSDVGFGEEEIMSIQENRRKGGGGGGWNALLSCRYRKGHDQAQPQPQPQAQSRSQYQAHSQSYCHKQSLNFNTKAPFGASARASFF